MMNEVARRLRFARESAGLSQQAVADAIEVTRTAITQMEAANRSVSTLELTRLAALYRRPVTWFLNEDSDSKEEDVLVALHRIDADFAQDPNVREQVERCLTLCREGLSLEKLLGQDSRSGPPSYEMHVPRNAGEAVSQGEQIAEGERRRLNIGSSPIADISELISTQGIWASGTSLPNQMSGLFLHRPSVGLAILVNATHPRARKRFSYAHEYAHALLDRNHGIKVSTSQNSVDLVEKRANAFAAAFLMPRNGVYELLRSLDKGLPSRQEQSIFDVASGDVIETELRSPPRSQQIIYKDVAMVAHHFGVSYQAAAYRLKSLRHISQPETQELLKQEQFGRRYLDVLNLISMDEPDAEENWDRELRIEVLNLAIEAYRREEISRGRLLELGKALSISSDTLLELGEAARGE
ncbi:MAG: XRE family transcriptional regulator [Desulforhabdus sp.]|jgi:Zn-dependent peptidase ImmA (M78 family)/transcriptional regulator with XRE-family HTH domain|nr:XRE family transcriptional regulator [Desulforhabdus sp.]